MYKIVFIDFDGTIIKEDSLDLLCEMYSNKNWKEKDKLWEMGEIGSLENLEFCLDFEITYKMLDEVIKKLTIRDGFFEFIEYLKTQNIEYYIVSEGIDYIIRKVTQIDKSKIFSNKLEDNRIVFIKNHQNCEFLDECKKCSCCKVNFINQFKNYYKIYIGNGYSDRFAIKKVDKIFATDKLVNICKQYIYFENFEDIKEIL